MVVLAALLVACGAGPAAGPQTDSAATAQTAAGALNVVATTSILGDLARNVGGDRVRVRTLLPAGSDPHTYTPTPADVQAVAEAQLLIENGLGLEFWLEEVTANAGGSRPTVVASEGLTPLPGLGHDDEHSAEASADGAAAEQTGSDPHAWFDVRNTISYVERIRDGLKQVDPAGASSYDASAARYIDQLTQLDAEIVQQTQTIPAERRKLITNHDTFGYFAQRYGFTIVGTVFAGVSSEQEPSAQQVAALVEQIRAQNVPAVFTENTVNPRLAEQIAAEAGVKVVTSLYTDALGAPGSQGDSYIGMMRFDVQQIVAALK